MNNLIAAIENEQNVTFTENGAKSFASTMNANLDLFGKIASSRKNVGQAIVLFSKALAEDEESAIRILFWARDIRGGQGERMVFRTLLKYLAQEVPSTARKVLELIPMYGRWDDLFILENTLMWEKALDIIEAQIQEDLVNLSAGANVSLLGKWMPSINASSKESRRIGRKLAERMGITEREYRKMLTALRSAIRIVEQKMCSNEWSEIDYEKLPSRASLMYRNAFQKHDPARYQEYISDVASGKAKIHSGTLYPHEIVEAVLRSPYSESSSVALEEMWKALPNYMEGNEFEGLVVADTSGSMMGTPMNVAVSLAMYISERNTCKAWKDKFITFSDNPQLQSVVGATLRSKIQNLMRADWGMSTNLQAVFKLILNTATSYKISNDEMPKKLIIISDMQFNQAVRNNSKTNFEAIREKYAVAGYELPEIVFWNVNAHADTPVKATDTGVALVSGCSPSTMTYVLSGKLVNPVELMNKVIYSDRYNAVGEALAA